MVLAAAGLAVLLLVWQALALHAGPLVLPTPVLVAARTLDLLTTPGTAAVLATTAADALGGLAAGGGVGLVAGLLAGVWAPLDAALRPVVTVILGVPHIAWVVLALLWFGPQGMAPAFTVAVSILPIIFLGARQGMRARAASLSELATVFALPRWQRLTDIVLPQVAIHLRAPLASAIGLSFKVAVMAEVLSGGAGVGGQVATARAYLQTDLVLAWIVLMVPLLLVLDALLSRALR